MGAALGADPKVYGRSGFTRTPQLLFFPSDRLLLVVYVDDLMLSGPAEHHQAFWTALAREVSLEAPEDLDRFYGRHHYFTACRRLDYDLREEFESTIEEKP